MGETGPGPDPQQGADRLVADLAQRHVDPGPVQQGELRSMNGRQRRRSSGVGLLAGGAHRTGAVIQAPVSTIPSWRDVLSGWLA